MKAPSTLVPVSLRGYQRAWLATDVLAGTTLAAVAIPEVMGYTTIAQTPVVTGLYTLVLPALAFALVGASRLLVVGGDSATAAILAAGLAGTGIAGLRPGSAEWVGLCGITALLCGVILIGARILRLGFLGDFLSSSALVGFLTGVGIQVASSQIPDLLGVEKGAGGWLRQQWAWISSLDDASLATVGFAAATLALILGFRRFVPQVPGAVIAVVGSIAVSVATDASTHGVAIVGALDGGIPSIGLPEGLSWTTIVDVAPTAFACFFIVVAQSAATARSFATKHGERADVNRDLLGLAAANIGAGISGTFVVNGSPTKTQILDEQRGRTQVANLTMAAVTVVVLVFLTGLLSDLPRAVLGGVVFLIGVDLVDVAGLRKIAARRRDELLIALATAATVVLVGVGPAVIVALVASLVDLVQRQYRARDFVLGVSSSQGYEYDLATPGRQSEPGLVVFRYDAELFYANASRFVDQVEEVVDAAPDPVRWLVLDCAGIDDVDYSAGQSLLGLLDLLDHRGIRFVLARPDADLTETLRRYGLLDRIPADAIYDDLVDAVRAFQASG